MPSYLKAITTKLPSYLQILLQDNYDIELVYQQGSEIGAPQFHEVKSEENLDETDITELDLTGTPLAVDLGGDDSVCRDNDVNVIPPSWSAEEAKYYPISLSEARTFINERLRLEKPNRNKPLIAICDGNDPLHTAILGVSKADNKLTRIVAYILKCHCEGNEISTFQYMKKDHINNVTRDAQVSYLVTKYYYLQGYDLRNCVSLSSNPNNGSIAVKESSNQIDVQFQKNASFKLILQVIVGHPSSSINSLWEELCFLQSFINILSNTTQLCEATVISEDYLDSGEIASLISDILVHNVKRLKKEANKPLDLQSLRDESIFDKLWSVLKRCRELSQLRNYVQFFFEELADSEDKLQNIGIEENSAISDIVTGILAGTVPTFTFSQSLELLIDLGLEKLKKDYLVIIDHFYSFAKDTVSAKWRSFNSENVTVSNKNPKRKSRLTINSKSVLVNVTSSKLKLSYLDSIHKVVEFILLTKGNLNMSEESFDHFYEVLANKFINSGQILPPIYDIKKPRLCEFSLNSFPTDDNIIKEVTPVAWTVKMVSTVGNSETTTVFYFSDHPIFPPSVCNDYDVSFNNSEVNIMYVTKLVKLVSRLGLFK